jgi:hypothetical protein
MISICVTEGSKRAVVKCDPKATTVEQFQELATSALGWPTPITSSSSSSQAQGTTATATGTGCTDCGTTTVTELFVDCFPQPRRPLLPSYNDSSECNPGDKNVHQLSLFDCGIRHQDRIFVVTSERPRTTTSSKASKSTSKQHKSLSHPKSHPPPQEPQQQQQQQRSRRKAAIAATESFAAIIQHQEEQEANQQRALLTNSKKSPTKTNTTSKKNTSSSSAARHFANLERIATRTNNTEVSGGRRLRDGAVTTTSPRRKRTKARSSSTMASTNRGEDIVEGLVSATTDTSSSARFMRKGWRQAVESAYEQNQANARVAASQNITAMVEFTILTPEGTSPPDDSDVETEPLQSQQLQVIYKKGVQGRGTYTDVVDYIHYDVLVATIAQIHPSEALRSFHLALLSPRVFWSLLYHYNKNHITAETGSMNQNTGDVVQASLQWCCPNLDWAYLRRRPEQLSEKAKENLRQKHEQSNPTTSTRSIAWEAAAAAIMSVEEAMDGMMTMTDNTTEAERSNQTNFDNDDVNNDGWQLFSETVLEMNDLIDCINSYEPDPTNDTTDYNVAIYPLNHVVYALTQTLKIQNFVELANIPQCPQELYDSLIRALSNIDKNDIPHRIADSDVNMDVTVPVTSAAIEQWVESAQQTTAHYSLISICDNSTDIVEILTDTLRCATPRDLLFWEPVPALCVDQIQNRWRDVAAASEDMTHDQINEWEKIIEESMNESNIRKWCRRAHIALGQVVWLNDYVTPIEFD